MKFALKLNLFLFAWILLFAKTLPAQDCHALLYIGEDFEYLADHSDDMEGTCSAAARSAQWKACVICAGDERRTQYCQVRKIINQPDLETKSCAAKVEVTSQNCPQESGGTRPLVHCEK